MSLNGAKLICLDDEPSAKEINVKGRKFAIGYYISCDYVLEDQRAKGVHCEINCDAFGRVTISNMSDEHPVVVNDMAICNKRALSSGSHINILGRKFIWEFPTKKCNELEILGNQTPQKKPQITEQAANSCPDFKLHRKIPKRLTVHRFGHSIQNDDESNASTSSVGDDQQEENDETSEGGDTPPKREKPTQPQTPKIDLINSTENKRSANTDPKKMLLSFCQQTDILITSFSPRQTGVRTEKSFMKLEKPRHKLHMTPKSLYSTPKGAFSDMHDDGSRDLMDFSTPATSNKSRTQQMANSSMHFIDFTSIKKLAPSSSSAVPKMVPKKLIETPGRVNTTDRDLGVMKILSTPESNLTSSPCVNAAKSGSGGSVISVGSVESPNSDSVIELSDDSLPSVDRAKSKERTPTRNATGGQVAARSIAVTTPKRTPQSLMKRALLTSAIKQARTPGRMAEALSNTPDRAKMLLTSPGTPLSAGSTSAGRQRLLQSRSATTPGRKSLATQSPLSPRTSMSRASVSKRLTMSTGEAPTTSTPLASAGSQLKRSASSTDYLHKVRKSLSGVPLTSHISKARKSLLTTKKSPPSTSSKLLAKARMSFCSPNLSTRSAKMLNASLSSTKSPTIGSTRKNDTNQKKTLADQSNDDLSRTFILDSVCEDTEEVYTTAQINREYIDVPLDVHEVDSYEICTNSEKNSTCETVPHKLSNILEVFEDVETAEIVKLKCSGYENAMEAPCEIFTDTSNIGVAEANVGIKTFETDMESKETVEPIKDSSHITVADAVNVENEEPIELAESVSDVDTETSETKTASTESNSDVIKAVGETSDVEDLESETVSEETAELMEDGSDIAVADAVGVDAESASIVDTDTETCDTKTDSTETNSDVKAFGEASEVEDLETETVSDETAELMKDCSKIAVADAVGVDAESALEVDTETSETNKGSTETNVDVVKAVGEESDVEDLETETVSEETAELMKDSSDIAVGVDAKSALIVDTDTETCDTKTDSTETNSDIKEFGEASEVEDLETETVSEETAELMEDGSDIAVADAESVSDVDTEASETKTVSTETNVDVVKAVGEESDVEDLETETVSEETDESMEDGSDIAVADAESVSDVDTEASETKTVSTETNVDVVKAVGEESDVEDLETETVSEETAELMKDSSNIAVADEVGVDAESALEVDTETSETKTVSTETNVVKAVGEASDVEDLETKTVSEEAAVLMEDSSDIAVVDATGVDAESDTDTETSETKTDVTKTNFGVANAVVEPDAPGFGDVETEIDTQNADQNAFGNRNSSFVEPNEAECFADVIEVQPSPVDQDDSVQDLHAQTLAKSLKTYSRLSVHNQSNVLKNIPISIESTSNEDEKENLSNIKDLPKTPNLRGIRELVKTPRNASPNFVGVRRLLRTPKVSANDTIHFSNLSELLKTPDASATQTEESKTFTPRRSARRVSSDSRRFEASRSPTRTRSMSTEPGVEKCATKTPKRTPRRASMSTAPADENTPRRSTTRGMSMSRADKSDDESSKQAPLRTPRLHRHIEDMDMGVIMEEDNQERSENIGAVKYKDKSVLDVFDNSDYAYGNEMDNQKGSANSGDINNINESVQIFETPESQIEIEESQETTPIAPSSPCEAGIYIPETPFVKSMPMCSDENRAKDNSNNGNDQELRDKIEMELEDELENFKDDTSMESLLFAYPSNDTFNPDSKQEEIKPEQSKKIPSKETEEIKVCENQDRTNPKTPKVAPQSPELSSYRTLMDTPKRSVKKAESKEPVGSDDQQNTPDMRGLRKMLRTPKIAAKTPRLGGVRDLLRTPKTSNIDEDGNDGIAELMATPHEEPSTSLAAISRRTAKSALNTPKYCSTPQRLRELFQTPKISSTPNLVGVKELLQTTGEVSEAEVEVHRALIDAKNKSTQDAGGLDKFFNTPRAKNVMIPQMPLSAIIEKSSVESDARTEYTLNESNAPQLEFELFKTSPINRLDGNTDSSEEIGEESKTDAVEGNADRTEEVAEESTTDVEFDKLAGQLSVHHTPNRKVYKRKSNLCQSKSVVQASPSAEIDLPQTDLEVWLDTVNSENVIQTDIEVGNLDETTRDTDSTETAYTEKEIIELDADQKAPVASKTKPSFDISGVEALDDRESSIFSEKLCVSDSESVVEAANQKEIASGGDTIDDDYLEESLMVSGADSPDDTLQVTAVCADDAQVAMVETIVIDDSSSEFSNFNENNILVEKRAVTPDQKTDRPKEQRKTLGAHDSLKVSFNVNEEKSKLLKEQQSSVVVTGDVRELKVTDTNKSVKNKVAKPTTQVVDFIEIDDSSSEFSNFNADAVVIEKRALTPDHVKVRPTVTRKTLGCDDCIKVTFDVNAEKSRMSKKKESSVVTDNSIDEEEEEAEDYTKTPTAEDDISERSQTPNEVEQNDEDSADDTKSEISNEDKRRMSKERQTSVVADDSNEEEVEEEDYSSIIDSTKIPIVEDDISESSETPNEVEQHDEVATDDTNKSYRSKLIVDSEMDSSTTRTDIPTYDEPAISIAEDNGLPEHNTRGDSYIVIVEESVSPRVNDQQAVEDDIQSYNFELKIGESSSNEQTHAVEENIFDKSNETVEELEKATIKDTTLSVTETPVEEGAVVDNERFEESFSYVTIIDEISQKSFESLDDDNNDVEPATEKNETPNSKKTVSECSQRSPQSGAREDEHPDDIESANELHEQHEMADGNGGIDDVDTDDNWMRSIETERLLEDAFQVHDLDKNYPILSKEEEIAMVAVESSEVATTRERQRKEDDYPKAEIDNKLPEDNSLIDETSPIVVKKRATRKRNGSHTEREQDVQNGVEPDMPGEENEDKTQHTNGNQTTLKQKDQAGDEEPLHIKSAEDPKEDAQTIDTAKRTERIRKTATTKPNTRKIKVPTEEEEGENEVRLETVDNGEEETNVKKDKNVKDGHKKTHTTRRKRKDTDSIVDAQQIEEVNDKSAGSPTESEIHKQHAEHDNDQKPVRKTPRRAAAVHSHNYDESSNPEQLNRSRRNENGFVARILLNDSLDDEDTVTPQKTSSRIAKKALTDDTVDRQSPAVPPKRGPTRARGKRLVSTELPSTSSHQTQELSKEQSQSDLKTTENLRSINEVAEEPTTSTASRRGVRKIKVQADPISSTSSPSQGTVITRKRGAKMTAANVPEDAILVEPKDTGRGRRNNKHSADKPSESQEEPTAEKPKRGRKPKAPEASSEPVANSGEEAEIQTETEISHQPIAEKPKRGRKTRAAAVVSDAVVHSSDEPDSQTVTGNKKHITAEKPKRGRKLTATEVHSESVAHSGDEANDRTATESSVQPIAEKPKRGRKPRAPEVDSEAVAHSGDEANDRTATAEKPKRGRKAKAAPEVDSEAVAHSGDEANDRTATETSVQPIAEKPKRGRKAKAPEVNSEAVAHSGDEANDRTATAEKPKRGRKAKAAPEVDSEAVAHSTDEANDRTATAEKPKRGRKAKASEVDSEAVAHSTDDANNITSTETSVQPIAEKPKRGRKAKAPEVDVDAITHCTDEANDRTATAEKPKRGRKAKAAPEVASVAVAPSSDEAGKKTTSDGGEQPVKSTAAAKRVRNAAATESPAVPLKRGRRKVGEAVDEDTPNKSTTVGGRSRKVVRFDEAPADEGKAKRVRK